MLSRCRRLGVVPVHGDFPKADLYQQLQESILEVQAFLQGILLGRNLLSRAPLFDAALESHKLL